MTAPTLDLHIRPTPTPPAGTTLLVRPTPLTASPASRRDAELAGPRRVANQMQTRARRFVQAIVEIIDGDRPVIQLLRMSTQSVYDDLVARLTSLRCASAGGAPAEALSTRVASVHVAQPQQDSAEISARLIQGTRSRALAVRLDLADGHWRCSAMLWG